MQSKYLHKAGAQIKISANNLNQAVIWSAAIHHFPLTGIKMQNTRCLKYWAWNASGCSFGSAQKLQNNQDVWVWVYWGRSLWFQMGISLQLDDAHCITQRKIKAPFFSSGRAKCKTMKIPSSESTGEHPVLPLSEKMNYFRCVALVHYSWSSAPSSHTPLHGKDGRAPGTDTWWAVHQSPQRFITGQLIWKTLQGTSIYQL